MLWNSRNVPELAGLNFRERMVVIRRATDMLETPKKLVLNLLKLAVLVPPFMAIARANSIVEGLGWAIALIVIYPLITRPVTFSFIRANLIKARRLTIPNSIEV